MANAKAGRVGSIGWLRSISNKRLVLGVLVYVLATLIYMQPVISNGCSTTLIGGPGDQTGFAWLYEANSSSPLWGFTNWSNAPIGEDVSQPAYITGLLPYTGTWLLTKVVQPICAFNIMTSFGFVFTATMMFLFMLWLTKRRSYIVSWFAGYLVAFSPYLLIKTPYHASYVFSGLLIALLWALIAFWRTPTYKKSLLIMVLLASVFYHDPYFILLEGILGISFLAGVLIHNRYFANKPVDVGRRIKLIALMVPVFLLLVSPVLYIRITKSAQIEGFVQSSRDTSIISEGRAYGARPWEYIFPAADNPFTPGRLKAFQLNHQHGSAVTETTLYLGIVPLSLAGWLLWNVVRHRRQTEREIKTAVDLRLVALVAVALVVVAGLFSLAPFFDLKIFKIHMPSELILHLTTMWRVPARLFVVVQLGVVILAALGLLLLLVRLKLRGWRRWALLAAIFLASFCEYMPFSPINRSYWSYKDIPAVYTDIKENPAVDTIAEYPLLDPPRNYHFIFYMTYQAYHEKPMINSMVTNSSTKQFRESLTDVNDWQTPGVLKQLGVDKVVLHVHKLFSAPGFEHLQASYDNKADAQVLSFDIAKIVRSKDYALTIGKGFDGPSKYSYEDIDFFMHQSGVLNPVLLYGAKPRASATARLEYYAFEKMPRPIQVKQDGKLITTLYPTENKQVANFSIDPNKKLDILPVNPPADYSFVISNMEIE